MSIPALRPAAALATTVLLALCATACNDDDSSAGDSADPTTSATPSTSAATPASTPPSTTATTATTATTVATGGCVTGAVVCETFDTDTAGWTDDNSADSFAGWDAYQGGSYRMVIRNGSAISVRGPYDITDSSPDYGVQIDVDALLGTDAPSGSGVGVGCWGSDDTDTYFELLLDDQSAYIALVSAGDVHVLDKEPAAGVLDTAGVNHLTAQCQQSATGDADLALTVNGQQLASVQYANSVQSFAWSVGPQVLLVADGAGTDVFYDNFAITGG